MVVRGGETAARQAAVLGLGFINRTVAELFARVECSSCRSRSQKEKKNLKHALNTTPFLEGHTQENLKYLCDCSALRACIVKSMRLLYYYLLLFFGGGGGERWWKS